MGSGGYLCLCNFTTYMKTTSIATIAYESPDCRAVKIDNESLICASIQRLSEDEIEYEF